MLAKKTDLALLASSACCFAKACALDSLFNFSLEYCSSCVLTLINCSRFSLCKRNSCSVCCCSYSSCCFLMACSRKTSSASAKCFNSSSFDDSTVIAKSPAASFSIASVCFYNYFYILCSSKHTMLFITERYNTAIKNSLSDLYQSWSSKL